MIRWSATLLLFSSLASLPAIGSGPLESTHRGLLAAIGKYAESLPPEFDAIPDKRMVVLQQFAEHIADGIGRNGDCHVSFICTHNSRRSHLSQVWAQTAALYFGIDQLKTYSGGTEATACNVRTIAALRRAGFDIEQVSQGTNPRYQIRYSEQAAPLQAFSKVYSDTSAGNPSSGFIAALCCSQADKECPVVRGAIARVPLHYEDPKVADDTPAESAKYDQRCRQIAVEMFYVMRLVANKTQ